MSPSLSLCLSLRRPQITSACPVRPSHHHGPPSYLPDPAGWGQLSGGDQLDPSRPLHVQGEPPVWRSVLTRDRWEYQPDLISPEGPSVLAGQTPYHVVPSGGYGTRHIAWLPYRVHTRDHTNSLTFPSPKYDFP